MDYSKIIDDETWAFIAETAKYYPPDAITLSIAEQRAVYDRMCRAFFKGYPAGVTARPDQVGEVPLRAYTRGASEVTVVYFHGGGFVVGGLESHDDVCAEICGRTGFDVTAVDYRMAPEHQHPVMFDDALAATHHVLSKTDGPILLCGDSAGGNLAAAVAHHTRDVGERILGQVLIYPALGGDMNAGSYLTHAEAPMLTRDDILFYQDIRGGGPDVARDPRYAPLSDQSFAGLPPTLVVTAECDPLSDDGGAYRDALRAAGGVAEWVNEPGLVHGYLRARTSVTRARDSFTRIIDTLSAMGSRSWHPDS